MENTTNTARVAHEHAQHETLAQDVFYPDHPARTESAMFRKTKRDGHAAALPCAISGRPDGVEYHHLFIEWAFTDAVDWHAVKRIGTGEITHYPVLGLETDQPTGEMVPIEHSLIGAIVKLAEYRGFDWHAFDPEHPETFVDSPQNMLVLHEKFHRGKDHGIHELTFPVWIFQAFPRVPGFVFSPDELHSRVATKH